MVCLQISIVSQEPTLFNCTIAENISYGLNGSVTPADIERVSVSSTLNLCKHVH